MTFENHDAPRVTTILTEPAPPDPARAGVIWVLTDGGRVSELATSDACCESGATRLLLNYLEEWLDEQPGTVSSRNEISTAPGLTWVGTMIHAREPEEIRQRFLREFCVGPALLPESEEQS